MRLLLDNLNKRHPRDLPQANLNVGGPYAAAKRAASFLDSRRLAWLRHAVGMTVLGLVLMVSTPALAEDFVYSPEGCEFRMVFPDEPYATQRCHDRMKDKCALMTTYTKVFDLDTTVNFYVSCNPADENMRSSFTPDLMRTSLLARPNVDTLDVYDISYNETEQAGMAALLGAGKSPNGNDTMLYVTQLWIGNASVLTLEGELIGKQSEETDKFFGGILSSLRHKNWNAEGTEGSEPPTLQDENTQDAEPAPESAE